MRVVLYVPYSNGDAKNGFKYEGKINQQDYANAMIKDYTNHKVGVDMMFSSGFFGKNIARNSFGKEKRKYNQQTFYYQPVEAKLFDIDGNNETMEELVNFNTTGEQFILIVSLLNLSSADESGELESDVKSWTSESIKVNRSNKMTDDEKIKSLSKKSLKIKFKDSDLVAILKNCKMVEVYYRNKFALLVESIEFIKE